MSIVYVLQAPPRKFSEGGGDRGPKYDLSYAERFGKMRYVLTFQEAKAMTIAQLQEAFESRLEKFTEKDYLLMLGSPVIQATAVLAAAPLVKKLPLLIYQRGDVQYTESFLDTKHIFWGQGNVALQGEER